MNLTTASMDLEDDQTRTKKVKLNDFTVRRDQTYINWLQLNTRTIQMDTMFSLSLSFLISLSWRVFNIIYLPLDHLHPTLVDHLSRHLSTCPIKHPLQFSVSCDSQGSTVQRSSPHKCGQKSSCNAFNVVVAAFPQIFLGFLPSHMFMRHVPIIGASWRVTLIARVHT